jgi:hypothetical protein
MRTLGTILGVVLGIPLLYFVPSIEGQLLLTIIFGVCFFYLSSKKYAMATLMATLMVLLIFNLKGAGYAIILPRIIDTLIGCAIAWFAVSFIWPDWDFRNISNTIKKASDATLNYFNAICEQYQHGKNNSLAYRSARRTAHNAQTELANMISSLSTEPNPNPELVHHAFRYLVYSHSQLSYISALGSHRELVQEVAEKFVSYSDKGMTLSAVNFPEIALPLTEGKHRLLHIHKNVPGVLSKINNLFAEHGINISGQSLMTKGDVGYLVMTPLCGHLSDKVGQRNMFMFGLLVLALYCYPFFTMLGTKDPVLVWTAIVLGIGVVFPIMYAPQAQLFARQFPAEIRYSGISISVQFAGVLGVGLSSAYCN